MTTRTEMSLLFAMIRDVLAKQETIMTKLYEIEDKTQKNTQMFQQSFQMFQACHNGFQQVKDACTCLREELSEHAGNMIHDNEILV